MFNEIRSLLYKEFLIEWRNRYALNGIVLYLTSTIFISYMSFSLRSGTMKLETWNALFWIILLFTSINAISKSFQQESASRMLYYYSLVSPQGIILSKMIYNTLLMIVLALPGYLIYSLVLGDPVLNHGLFLFNLVLGAIGFASCFTLVSGIASKAGNNLTLMAILSFPVIIPVLLLLITISHKAMTGFSWAANGSSILVLMAINAIIITVSYLLFPYLWRN